MEEFDKNWDWGDLGEKKGGKDDDVEGGRVKEDRQGGNKLEVHFDKIDYYEGQFEDVPDEQWFTEAVANAYEYGLMKGISNTEFNPYGDVSIAQAITMASRIYSTYMNGEDVIKSKDGEPWYQAYYDYAYENDIINDELYNTDASIKATRAQFAEIFANSLPVEALYTINNVESNSIPDIKSSSSYASSVYKLYRAGILGGSDATGKFSPLTFITRAEASVIVSRLADTNNRITFSLGANGIEH